MIQKAVAFSSSHPVAVVLGAVPSLKGRKGIPKYNLRLSVYSMLQIGVFISSYSESREPCPYVCFGPWILTDKLKKIIFKIWIKRISVD